MNEKNSENVKPKKKFKLDPFSTMLLAALVFMIAQETGTAGKEIGGVNTDTVISIICYVVAAVIFFLAIRKIWNNRKAQIIARLDAEELAAKQAAEAAAESETDENSIEDAEELEELEEAEEADDTDENE